jgi:oligoribonuclease NrnB/cAMP/cGMP phosphodiesterase (DHH superfamily)
MKKLCIYHGNCTDGFGAAWVVRKALGDTVEFHPGVYQEAPPDVAGREVIMVDFSYKRPEIIKMAAKAKSILILDHHKSAQGDLVDLPDNVTAFFDMGRSGAVIAWDHFFPHLAAPYLLQIIQDRDLWRFEFPETKAVQAALFSYPYDFEVWDDLVKAGPDLEDEGEAIMRKQMKDIQEMIDSGFVQRATICGHDVPVLNCPYFYVSEAGHILAEGEDFAACYWDIEGYRVFGLRSKEDGVDVSEIASQYGGGGHKHAAGFKVPIPNGHALL